MRLPGLATVIGQVAVVVGLIALWQWMADTGAINTYLLGEPSLVWQRLDTWGTSGRLWTDLRATLLVLVIGYAAGLAAGAVLGTLLGLVPLAKDVLEPFVIFINGMPRLLLYPLLVVVIGIGQTSRIVLVIAAVFVIVAVSIAAGIREIPQDILQNMRISGASQFNLARHVYLPALTVWLLSSLRATIGIALSATILAEFLGASSGIGYEVVQGEANLDVNQIWAAIVVVIIVALAVYLLVGTVERKATRWMLSR